jgi:hypothetical protein
VAAALKGARKQGGIVSKRVVISLSLVCAASMIALREAPVGAQASFESLQSAHQALMKRLPAPSDAAIEAALANRRRLTALGPDGTRRAGAPLDFCITSEGNPVSGLVAYEESPAARAMEGFVKRDQRGRRTRPWRALRKAEQRQRGVVVHRPLLVFMETPATRQDFSKPWFGPVRFDRPGFPTTKQRIAEQVFGRNFDHRDPESVAGFYFRESGGSLVIKGDASSIFTITVPHMHFQAEPIAAAILAQLDPLVDFTKRADEFGWVDPIFVMTPFSHSLDTFDPPAMGNAIYIGYGPTVYDDFPAITNDRFADGTHAALSSLAISVTGAWFGSTTKPADLLFGMPEGVARTDDVTLYAHEYGHAIGLSHMMTQDFGLQQTDLLGPYLSDGFAQDSLSREWGSGFASTIMNYSYGSGRGPRFQGRDAPAAGLDPVNRTKLGWGHVTEITLTDDPRPGHDELAPGSQRRVSLVEHLGAGARDTRPQILKVNLPPREVALFPATAGDGSPSGYWRPGNTGRRMVWSGRTFGGSRVMETSVHIPRGLSEPVLGFWTKYGAHSGQLYPAGYEFGWVQISTDHGRTWTSLAGQTSSTVVAPGRDQVTFVGEDLGAPAFTGDSRTFAADGWVFEQIPLPVSPGSSVSVRFNFSGWGLANEDPSEDFGWWIDDVYLGTTGEPTRHLISDFEHDDRRDWQGLLTKFEQGFGFVAVEETTDFPQAYFFELRGNNAHDEVAFKSDIPKDVNGRRDDALYRYEDGVVGYYVDYYASFWAYPFKATGSATSQRVPISRLKRQSITYPIGPQFVRVDAFDFSFLLALAFTPNSGFTLGDLSFLTTLPQELFTAPIALPGFVVAASGRFPPNAISLLDASPTYRPLDLQPSAPSTPFPDRPIHLWPHVLGAPGGWPKSVAHGLLGLNDPTTVRALGQPYLGHDAAFHPERTPVFDDSTNYRGAFVQDFVNWHAPTTQSAFGSASPARRITMVPAEAVPIGAGGTIQKYEVRYCESNAADLCVPAGQAASRPWIDQMMYQRLAPLVYFTIIAFCPPEPTEFTAATKPAWESFYACLGPATEDTHLITVMLLDAARTLGQNGYPGLNPFGDKGTLSPGLWAAAYLDFWTRAKAPVALPSFGFSMEVEEISHDATRQATLRLRRAQ